MFFSLLLFLQVLTTPITNVVTTPQFSATKSATECNVGGFFGIPTWYKYIKSFDASCNPIVSLRGDTSAQGCVQERDDNASTRLCSRFNGVVFTQILLAVVDILVRIGALVAVGFVLYGGFTFITSQGEPDGTKRGRTTIVNALVGLVIAIFASAIVAFIGGRLGA